MALPTSGTYNFLSTEVATIIDHAFQGIGKTPSSLVSYDIFNARTKINLICLDWVNRGINLWLLQTSYLSLARYQSTYALDSNIADVIQVNTRTFNRALGGVPKSLNLNISNNGTAQSNTTDTYDGNGGGDANNPFTTSSDGCTQTSINGNISYYYGVGHTRTLRSVGIISNVDATYTLVLEASNNSADWEEVIAIPVTDFEKGLSYNFAIPAADVVTAAYYRIRETDGETLDIQNLYFNTGIPSYAFDGLSTTSCTQEDTNGLISYTYPDLTLINFIGITSNTTQIYKIHVTADVRDDGNYVTILEIPSQVYVAGVPVWFDIPVPISALTYDILESTAADDNPVPLDIQELYLANNTWDIPVSLCGRSTYNSFANKGAEGRPSNFYFNRQIAPTLSIYPLAADQYKVLQLSCETMVQDVGSLTNALQVPPLFYPALIEALTTALSYEYRPEASAALEAKSERTFARAYAKNTENLTYTITTDWGSI